jgi:hypothetical protein
MHFPLTHVGYYKDPSTQVRQGRERWDVHIWGLKLSMIKIKN